MVHGEALAHDNGDQRRSDLQNRPNRAYATVQSPVIWGMSVLSACALCCGIFSMPQADASVRITIDLSAQTMHVSSDMGSYDWRVSTARLGYRTPRGTYRPYQLQRTHFSHKYHMSPMPYSIFFAGGYAIHGTYESASLGRPVSHGCIRLAPGNA